MILKNWNNAKKLWFEFDKLDVHKKKRAVTIPDGVKDPNEINDYFINAIGHGTIDPDILNKFRNGELNPNLSSSFKDITSEDIRKILGTIKSRSVGFDGISLKMLKIVLPYCNDLLRELVDESLNWIISFHMEKGYHCANTQG
ncbi:hypothetical protein HHI36_010862 [Cryptolaemus montrouzieri]|uniref:Reverse transcriptase n=1 Tax=Cryptolaemus montrouzieri TaxID=559131 RepID=A0ABD2MK18_9CUCU